jgi:hypothetical protein
MEEAVRPNLNGNQGRLASSEVGNLTREGANPLALAMGRMSTYNAGKKLTNLAAKSW